MTVGDVEYDRGWPLSCISRTMTPEQALLRVVHCLDRAHDKGFKAKAFVRALDVVRNTPPDEIAERAEANTLTDLDGIGSSTAAVITQALNGDDDLSREDRGRVAGHRSRPRGRCTATR